MKDEAGKGVDKRIPLLFFILLPLILTFPLLFSFSTKIVGDIHNFDNAGHIWKLWWFRYALSHSLDPFFALLEYYPTGIDLFVHHSGFMDTLFALPFLFLLKPVVIHNIYVLFLIFLNGFSVFLLSKRLTGREDFSILAGFIANCNPHIIGEMFGGRCEEYTFFPLPLFLLFFIRTLEERGLQNLLLAAVFFSAGVISTLVLPLMTGLIAPYFLAIHLIRRGLDLPCLKRVSLLGVVILLLFLPYILKFKEGLDTSSWEGGLVGRRFPSPEEILRYEREYESDERFFQLFGNRDTIKYGIPYNTIGQSLSFDPSLNPWPLVLILLYILFAITPLLFRDARRASLPLLLLALFMLILALGPYLRIDRRFVWSNGKYLPLPFILFYDFIPFFHMNRYPERFLQLFFLFSSICWARGGYEVARGLNLKRGARRLLLASLLVLYTAGLLSYPRLSRNPHLPEEAFLLPLRLSSLPEVHDFYREMKGSEEGGIIELPQTSSPFAPKVNDFYYQTVHEKPLLFGVGGAFHSFPEYASFINTNSFIVNLLNWSGVRYREGIFPFIDPMDIEVLGRAGFSHIVINHIIFKLRMGESLHNSLEILFGAPRVDDSADPPISVFDLSRFSTLHGQGASPFRISEDGTMEFGEFPPLPDGMEGAGLISHLVEEEQWNDALRAIERNRGAGMPEDEASWFEGVIYMKRGMVRNALALFASIPDFIERDSERKEEVNRAFEKWCGHYIIDKELCSSFAGGRD